MKFIPLTFDRDHTHAGQPIQRGEKRDIPAYNAEWLIAQGIAHLTPPTSSPSTTARTQRSATTEETDHGN